MRKKLYVDGVDLSTFGLYISGQGTFGSGAKEFTFYNIPGRDGAVLGVNSRLENVSVTYPGFIYASFAQNMRDLRSFLLSRSGYVRIEDDYDTTHFRMGVFEEPISPDVTPVNDAGRFDLVFNCLPQRWLKSGETPVTKAETGSTGSSGLHLTNPTRFSAKPLITVVGSYGISVRDSSYSYWMTVDVDNSGGDITGYTIDCETMQVYDGNTNLSSKIGFRNASQGYGADAPILKPGESIITCSHSGGIISVTVTPRWWEV